MSRNLVRQVRPALEPLGDRLAPAVFIVNTLADTRAVDLTTGKDATGHISLRSAVMAANVSAAADTIDLALPGTYKITLPGVNQGNNTGGAFAILSTGGNLTLKNTSGGRVTVDGNRLDRVFDINPTNAAPPCTVSMQGFTITNGFANSASQVPGTGGGIRDVGTASLTLTNMTVTGNSASQDGGGIAMENLASTPWTLTLTNSVVSANRAGGSGGGVETDGSGTVVVTNSRITGNTSVNQGGGVWLDAVQVGATFQGANLTVTNSFVANNQAIGAGGVGGGIGNTGNGTVTITGSSIDNNFAGAAGGGYGDQNGQGTLSIANSTVRNNVAVGNGGGIAAAGPSTALTNDEVDGNQSGGAGGGLFAGGRTLSVSAVTLADNFAAGPGGGIEVATSGTGLFFGSSIINTTITGNSALNTAGAAGGGIDAGGFTGDLRLINDTITANSATTGGGVSLEGTGNFGVENTIIAANTAIIGPDVAPNPTAAVDLGGNLIGVFTAGSGFAAATTQKGTTANPLAPNLGPLRNNGGPTVGATGHTQRLLTMAPLRGSPAINKGILSNAPGSDERGLPSLTRGLINVGAVSLANLGGL